MVLCVVLPDLTPCARPFPPWGELPNCNGIGRTRAYFSGQNSLVMEPCFSPGSLHCFVQKCLKNIKGVPQVFGKLLGGGGNKGIGFEIRVLGAAVLAAGELWPDGSTAGFC